MLKKIFSVLLLAVTVCTLGGYEIRKNETVVPDGDLSDWKNIPFQRIAGERFSSDPLRYKGVHDAAVSLAIVWNETQQAFLLAGKIQDESLLKSDRVEFSISAKKLNYGHWGNPVGCGCACRSRLSCQYQEKTDRRIFEKCGYPRSDQLLGCLRNCKMKEWHYGIENIEFE